MERICLDTDVIIDFLCGDKTIVEKLRYYSDREQICVTVFTLLQLQLAIKKAEVLNAFVANVTPFAFDKRSAVIASRIINELEEAGKRINIESVITAAICIENGAFLFTKNRSAFEGIKGLKLV